MGEQSFEEEVFDERRSRPGFPSPAHINVKDEEFMVTGIQLEKRAGKELNFLFEKRASVFED